MCGASKQNGYPSMRLISLIAVFAVSLGLPANPAFSSERDATAKERQRVVQHLSRIGYTQIIDVDVVRGRFEVDARSPKGREVDVILDMRSLRILAVNAS
jgi:hypothetical protein